MTAKLLYVFLTFLHLFSTTNVKSEDEKRLLLDEPGTEQSLLHQYEAKLNEYGIALQQLESKVSTMEIENAELKRIVEGHNQSSIVTYIRWGRTACASDPQTELLYKGVTGGSLHNTAGSGVNALCLPHSPDNGINIHGLTSQKGYHSGSLYGAEYQYDYKNVRLDDDVPCAVCLVKNASAMLLMPAKASCPAGWKTEYSGILTTNSDDFHKSEYTCMDNDPEYIEGTRIDNFDGKLFYPVRTVCGSLPCPPYKNGTFVECAVCTR